SLNEPAARTMTKNRITAASPESKTPTRTPSRNFPISRNPFLYRIRTSTTRNAGSGIGVRDSRIEHTVTPQCLAGQPPSRFYIRHRPDRFQEIKDSDLP